MHTGINLIPAAGHAFTQLRFQTMPIEYLAGRLYSRQVKEHFCECRTGPAEDAVHYILYCPLYNSPRIKCILPLQASLQGQPEDYKTRWLLAAGLSPSALG